MPAAYSEQCQRVVCACVRARVDVTNESNKFFTLKQIAFYFLQLEDTFLAR
jgi:hypothetical protein